MDLNGFSSQFQMVVGIKNIRLLSIFKWVFIGVLWTHLLKYQCILCKFKWVFIAIFIDFEHNEYQSVLCKFKWVFMALSIGFEHQEYWSVM